MPLKIKELKEPLPAIVLLAPKEMLLLTVSVPAVSDPVMVPPLTLSRLGVLLINERLLALLKLKSNVPPIATDTEVVSLPVPVPSAF